jgi:hypothetical protein
MKRSLQISFAFGLFMTAFSALAGGAGSGGGAGPTRISEAQARAAGANTLTPGGCVAFCERRGSSKSQCANNCRVNQCYSNASTGNSYCVKTP